MMSYEVRSSEIRVAAAINQPSCASRAMRCLSVGPLARQGVAVHHRAAAVHHRAAAVRVESNCAEKQHTRCVSRVSCPVRGCPTVLESTIHGKKARCNFPTQVPFRRFLAFQIGWSLFSLVHTAIRRASRLRSRHTTRHMPHTTRHANAGT